MHNIVTRINPKEAGKGNHREQHGITVVEDSKERQEKITQTSEVPGCCLQNRDTNQ